MNIGQRVQEFLKVLTNSPETMVAVITSIIIFAVIYFFLISFLVSNNASWLVILFVFAMVLFGAVIALIESINGAFLLLIPCLLVIAIMTLYSVEIKRMVWAYKNLKLFDVKHTGGRPYDQEKTEQAISEIIKAVQNLSKKNTGALIVLAAGEVPEQILDSGVRINSDISSELIESIFFPNTALHDGAMVISGTKIISAGCFLPLSHNDNIPKDLGTRHRAGIGITETIDVTSLIVSEETGIISIAKEGKITRYVDAEMIRKTLNKYYWQDLDNYRK